MFTVVNADNNVVVFLHANIARYFLFFSYKG